MPRDVIDIEGTMKFGDLPLTIRIGVPVSLVIGIITVILRYVFG